MENKEYSVYLRAFEEGDYKLINEWRKNPKINAHTTSRFRYVSSEKEKEWVREKMMNNKDEEYFAVCLNDGSDRMVGYFSIRDIDYVNRVIGATGITMGDKEHQNPEIIIDCFLLIFDYVFNHMGMHRLSGKSLETHIDSRTMMEMLGFKYEGTQRDCLIKNGIYHNITHYSLLDEEYYKLLEDGSYNFSKLAKRALKIRKQIKESLK